MPYTTTRAVVELSVKLLNIMLDGYLESPSGEEEVVDDWIKDGFLDLLRLPLHPILKQALQEDEEPFRAACTMLSTIAAHGGREAGVFLLGLLTYCRPRPERLVTVASALGSFASEATVEALAGELYRVESTNATRKYLTEVLDALTRLPCELWEPKLVSMTQDAHFSQRWRQKFEGAL